MHWQTAPDFGAKLSRAFAAGVRDDCTNSLPEFVGDYYSSFYLAKSPHKRMIAEATFLLHRCVAARHFVFRTPGWKEFRRFSNVFLMLISIVLHETGWDVVSNAIAPSCPLLTITSLAKNMLLNLSGEKCHFDLWKNHYYTIWCMYSWWGDVVRVCASSWHSLKLPWSQKTACTATLSRW